MGGSLAPRVALAEDAASAPNAPQESGSFSGRWRDLSAATVSEFAAKYSMSRRATTLLQIVLALGKPRRGVDCPTRSVARDIGNRRPKFDEPRPESSQPGTQNRVRQPAGSREPFAPSLPVVASVRRSVTAMAVIRAIRTDGPPSAASTLRTRDCRLTCLCEYNRVNGGRPACLDA